MQMSEVPSTVIPKFPIPGGNEKRKVKPRDYLKFNANEITGTCFFGFGAETKSQDHSKLTDRYNRFGNSLFTPSLISMRVRRQLHLVSSSLGLLSASSKRNSLLLFAAASVNAGFATAKRMYIYLAYKVSNTQMDSAKYMELDAEGDSHVCPLGFSDVWT